MKTINPEKHGAARSYDSVFDAIMKPKRARRAEALSRALLDFRVALMAAGLSQKKADKAVRSIKLSDIL